MGILLTNTLFNTTHHCSSKTKTIRVFFSNGDFASDPWFFFSLVCVCSLVSWCCLLSWTEQYVRIIITFWFIEFINLFVIFHSTANIVLKVCTFQSLFDVQCSNITVYGSYYWLQLIWWWIIHYLLLYVWKLVFFLGMISICIHTAERNERREMSIEHWASSTE